MIGNLVGTPPPHPKFLSKYHNRTIKYIKICSQAMGSAQGDEYEGMWTCLTQSGEEKGPCTIADLCTLFVRYDISPSGRCRTV